MAAAQLMLPANRAFDSNGFPEAGATVKLYQSGTTTPANFYADNALTISLGSTLVANAAGRLVTVAYQDTSTPFRLKVFDANGDELDDIDPYYFGLNTVGNLPNGSTVVNRTALASITNVADGQSAILSESGREGTFVFSTADLSAEVAADPLQGVYVPPSSDTTGASGAWVRKFDGAVQVNWFGAKGDGATDDVLAIRAAMAVVAATGGGPVLLPEGTYLVGNGGAGTTCLAPPAGVNLVGCGASTIIKVAPGANSHAISLLGVNNAGVYNLAIDGNRASNPTGHGIRLQDVDGATVRDILIQNVGAYGLSAAAGTVKNVTVDNVDVDGCGDDAFDIHNDNSLDDSNFFINCRARNWGLGYNAADPTTFTKCGFDGRGIVNVVNFRAESPGAPDAVGFRLREGEVGDLHGLGSHKSHVSNINVRMNDTANSQKAMVVNCREVTVTGANLTGARTGLQVSAPGFKGFGITATGNYSGVALVNSGGLLVPDKVELHGCDLSGNTINLTLPANVAGFKMFGGDLSNAATQIVSYGGAADAAFRDVTGYMTGVVAQSSVASTVTGTTALTTLASITIPGGMLKANGRIEIDALLSATANANSKSYRVYLGATQIYSFTVTGSPNGRMQLVIQNRNSETAQVGIPNPIAAAGGFGFASTALVTAAVDTTVDQNLTIRALLTVATDAATLEAFKVTIVPKS